ncbi:MAG: acyl-CoA thioesterase [Flavobacteriaceae bacterium]|nr:acyl-CoA thioesterase [Flavobacteriaceae bacterium]
MGYSYTFKVDKIHLDTLKHVNNIVYLKWVQDASVKHWDKLVNTELKKENVWMALRHEIDYLNQAFLDDTITIYTWIEESKGVKSTRIVHMYKQDTLLAKCKTIWVLLDAKSLRPKRIGEEILKLFSANEPS